MATNWFGKSKPPPSTGQALPPNDPPEAAPRPQPKLSPARAAAIAKLIESGYVENGIKRPVRDVRHALFLAQAGVLELPA